MSVLKQIVFFAFTLQLALTIVNNVEITPGVVINTTQITTGQANLKVNESLEAIGNLRDILTNSALHTRHLRICAGDYVPIFVFITKNMICFDTPVSSNPSEIEKVVIFISSLITLFLLLLYNIISLIYNSTAGAVFLYTNLFSIIDPVLGTVIGVALGSLQALLVLWGLTEFIPTLPNKEA